MQINLFKEVVSSISGSGAVKIIDLLYGQKNVNEFIIAKKLKLTINQTRNILYKLGDEGIVSFVRKKDKKKGGWYTYFWTLNVGKSLYKFKDKLVSDIATLEQQVNTKKNNQFFGCPNCMMEYNSENALLNQYTCPECGEVLQLKDASQDIAEKEKQIMKMRKMLSEIDVEIAEIEKTEGKTKQRKIKAEAKKKSKARQAKKKEKEQLLKKLAKKFSFSKSKKGKAKKGKR
jgi:transcription factor E